MRKLEGAVTEKIGGDCAGQSAESNRVHKKLQTSDRISVCSQNEWNDPVISKNAGGSFVGIRCFARECCSGG